jgi:ribosomal RNA-processing protein 9
MDRVAFIDDDLFVTGSDNGSLSLWSLQKKKPVFVLVQAHGLDPPMLPSDVSAEKVPDPKLVPAPQPRWITALRTLPYSDVILSGSWDGTIRVWKLSEEKNKILPVGILGKCGIVSDKDAQEAAAAAAPDAEQPWLIKGVVNDISLFERGDRGKDGLCVVAAVGKEHRLGRWKTIKNGKNGAVIFEVPKLVPEADKGIDT